MNRIVILTIFSVFSLQSYCLFGQINTVKVNVNPDKVTGQIDEKVYGQFLEHIYHSVNGGLWGDVVWNRSFEEKISGEDWMIGNRILESTNISKEAKISFGDASWRDYDFSFKALKLEGNNGFSFGIHGGSITVLLGNRNNQRFEVRRNTFNKKENRPEIIILDTLEGRIESSRWYQVKIRSLHERTTIWLDNKQIFDFKDSIAQKFGPVVVLSDGSRMQFSDFKVTLNNKILFSGLPSPARHWLVVGNCKTEVDNTYALNSSASLKITSQNGESGIQQNNFYLTKGNVCRGSLWMRGKAPKGIAVRLTDNDKVLFEQILPSPTSQWKEYPLILKTNRNVDNASLQIIALGEAEVWLDQVSLMPDKSKENDGFRPDLYNAMADIKPTIIRWPGGSFLNGYIWQNTIGPQSKRIGKKGWDEIDPLSMGIDEFMVLCRKLHAEPLIPLDVKNDTSIQGVIDLIEYCNGPKTSKWGKVRAENGHPEPYNIRYWEIGNENWGLGTEVYSKKVHLYAPLMKKADPSIKIIVCGSGGLGMEGRGLAWNRDVISNCADLADFISIHHYENSANYATGPAKFEKFWNDIENIILKSRNPKMKIYVSEWNAGTYDWRSGLYCGGILNQMEKSSGLITMAAPALWLRHVSAGKWDNAFINFNHRTWFAGSNYVVMKLWRESYAPDRIELTGDTRGLNMVATKSNNGKIIYLKIVNPTNETIKTDLKINDEFKISNASMKLIAPGQIMAMNSLDNPEEIKAVSTSIVTDSNGLSFEMPAISAGVVMMNCK